MVVLSFSVQPTAPLARMHYLHPSSQSLPASGSPEKGRFHLACFRHTNRWSEIARFLSLQECLYGWTAASSSYLDSLGRPAGQRPRSYAPPLTLTKNAQPGSAVFARRAARKHGLRLASWDRARLSGVGFRRIDRRLSS